MDRDNEISYMFSSSGAPRVSVSPGLRLKRLRDRLNEPVFTVRPTRARRVVAYVRTWPGEAPDEAFETLRAEAARRGWKVGHELHDATGPLAPQQSPAWRQTRKLLHEGFADGVLALDRDHISADDHAYELELAFVAERQCFTALLRPEAAT
jgi:hypothetical protein